VFFANIPPKPLEFDNREFLDYNFLSMWGTSEYKPTQDKIDIYRSKIKPLHE